MKTLPAVEIVAVEIAAAAAELPGEAIDENGHPKKRAMLAALAKTGNITVAALAAQVGRATHYLWLDEDPEYRAAARAAMEQAADLLEAEACRRAAFGVEEPVYQGGERVGTIRRYSDTLLIFLLKGARPEKYRERIDHNLRGQIRHAATPANLSHLTEEDLDHLDALAQKLAIE